VIKNERHNGETGDRITIEVLRPRIVETIEIVLKERRHRPDDDGSEKRGIAFRDVAMSILHGGKRVFAVSSLALQTIKASDTNFQEEK
jgi:hypothetical protein